MFRGTSQLIQDHTASKQIHNYLRQKPVFLSIMLYFHLFPQSGINKSEVRMFLRSLKYWMGFRKE